MSELQVSLLFIGLLAVAGVFLYGQWQQWRYRRSLGAPLQDEPTAVKVESPARVDHLFGAEDDSALPQTDIPLGETPADDATCGLLNDASDYVVTFLLKNNASADVLERLWLLRFDFGKTVNACGLNAASGRWERMIPESPQMYRAFRFGVQLVDRAGPISAIRLTAFRELLQELAEQLKVEVRLPTVEEALERAQALDRFCADVDQMIGLNLMSVGDRTLFGSDVATAATRLGMALEADGTFHLTDDKGMTLFTLSASDGTPFQHHTLNQLRVASLTLLLDIPRTVEPARHFDEMVGLAQELARVLRLTITDDQRVALSDAAIAQVRMQVEATEKLMHAGHITPGSAQALRLFS